MKQNIAIEEQYGPQCEGDIPFTRNARLLQSYYRVKKLEEKEFGIGPNKNSVHIVKHAPGADTGMSIPSYYGNMLQGGDNTGKNFFYDDTFK